MCCGFIKVGIENTCTDEVREIQGNKHSPTSSAPVCILTWLPVVTKAFMVSSLFHRDRLNDPVAVQPEWRSVLVAPPVAKVLDHPRRVSLSGRKIDTLKIGKEVNRLEPIDAIRDIGGFRIKGDSLWGN